MSVGVERGGRSTLRVGGSASASVYQALKDDIMRFNFKPGERLFEERLSERYEVSRTPIREALGQLEQEGLIIARGSEGRFVQHFNVSDYEEIYEVRIALEALSVHEVCKRADASKVEILRRTWDEGFAVGQAALDGSYVVADERFHIGLVELSGNAYLLDSLKRVHDRLHAIRGFDFTTRDRLVATRTQHEEILDLILAGRSSQASEVMRSHIAESKENIRELVARLLARVYIDNAG